MKKCVFLTGMNICNKQWADYSDSLNNHLIREVVMFVEYEFPFNKDVIVAET